MKADRRAGVLLSIVIEARRAATETHNLVTADERIAAA
jgi:hypothetical protein